MFNVYIEDMITRELSLITECEDEIRAEFIKHTLEKSIQSGYRVWIIEY